MREIKFRAWCLDRKIMDNEFFINSVGVVYDGANRTYDTPNTEIEENPNLIIMQFTGLQDKNGVDIYEYMEIDGLYNVEFRDGSYVLIDISNSDVLLLYNYINSRGGNVKITREYTKI